MAFDLHPADEPAPPAGAGRQLRRVERAHRRDGGPDGLPVVDLFGRRAPSGPVARPGEQVLERPLTDGAGRAPLGLTRQAELGLLQQAGVEFPIAHDGQDTVAELGDAPVPELLGDRGVDRLTIQRPGREPGSIQAPPAGNRSARISQSSLRVSRAA